MSKSRKRVAPSIYRSKTGRLVERVRVNGRPTWRVLGARTISQAKIEVAARVSDQARALVGLAKSPYAPGNSAVAAVIEHYLDAGCPDNQRGRRPAKTESEEKRRCAVLLEHWGGTRAPNIQALDRYAKARMKEIEKTGRAGRRTVDLELQTLSNAYRFAVRAGIVPYNPLAIGRPRYSRQGETRHCREVMPESGDELHLIANYFLESSESAVLGWQMLFQANYGVTNFGGLTVEMGRKERASRIHRRQISLACPKQKRRESLDTLK